MSLPGISRYCSTYGRPKRLLENSIQCFLEQDYQGPKELVILNDFDQQELIFNHPEVKKDRFYIYVWAGSQSYHASGHGPDHKNISVMAEDIVKNQIVLNNVQTGKIYLEPKLRYNFCDYLPTGA